MEATWRFRQSIVWSRAEKKRPFDPARLQIITLATPFLQVVDYPIRNPFLSSIVLWLPCSWLLLTGFKEEKVWDLLLLLPHLDYGQSENWMAAGATLAFALAAGTVTIITAFKLMHGAYFKVVAPERVGDARQVTQSLIWQSHYTVPDKLPINIIRGVSDEASLALSAGALASRLSLFLNEYVVQVFLFLLTVSLAFEIGFILWSLIATLPTFINRDLVSAVWQGLVGIGVPTLLVARASAMLLKLVYGRELFLSPPRCEIDTSGVPDVNRNATLTTLDPLKDGDGLHHSIYDHDLCQEIVADYVAAHAYAS